MLYLPPRTAVGAEEKSIPFPLIIVSSGQVLEAVLFNDGSAHRSGFYYRELVATFTDFLQPDREQTGVKSLPSIFRYGRASKQGGKVTFGEIRPCHGGGLVIHIRNVNAQISGDFKVHPKPVIDPCIVIAIDPV